MAKQEVFYQVVSGDKTLPVYDVDAHSRIVSGNAAITELSGKVTEFSGEYASFSGDITNTVSNLSTAFDEHIADDDIHITSQERTEWNDGITNLGELSGKCDEHIANSDIHITAEERTDWNDGIINLNDLSGKCETHIADSDIHITSEERTEWNANTTNLDELSGKCETHISDTDIHITTEERTNWNNNITNLDTLSGKYETHVAEFTDYKTSAHQEFVNTSGWANETFQPIGNYLSSTALDEYYTSSEVDAKISDLSESISATYGDLFNTTLKAGYGIHITSAAKGVQESGKENVEYTITTDPPVLDYGLFNSNAEQVFSTTATVLEFINNGDIQGENISLDASTHQIALEPGAYHIDIQVEANVDGVSCALTNIYYDGILLAGPAPERSVKMSIDGSYPHIETFTLSYDLRVATAQTLTFTMTGLPDGCKCYARLNIHEILTLEAAAEAIGHEYRAGDGLKLENDTFSIDVGGGLTISAGNKLEVKTGKGLKISTEGGVDALTIDGEVGEVVDTVNTLSEAIATKITTNYPPTMITDSHGQVMAGTQYTPGNGGCLYGTLFNTSITHPIFINKTLIGLYSYTDNIKAILGIYEYQPDYDRQDGTYGRTVALCDTGIVTIMKGFNEFPIKHLNNTIGAANSETIAEMKTNCMYYASIYLGYRADYGANDLQVACAASYSPQYGNIKPALSMANVNGIKANITNENDSAYDADLSFNDMGFNWHYTSYPAKTDTTSTLYFEANSAPRMYMQIRNIK